MRFAARELKPYGEFMRPADLVEGETYFRISFLDREMKVPELVPLVYVGRNLQPGQAGLFFQNASSYAAGERYDPNGWVDLDPDAELPPQFQQGADCWFETMPETEFTLVLEFEKALDQLLVCSLRRRGQL